MRRAAVTLFALCVLALACGSSGPASDAGADGSKPDGGIDCSLVGCAMPPPCGQPCTAVCGCCTNPSCADSGASDASGD